MKVLSWTYCQLVRVATDYGFIRLEFVAAGPDPRGTRSAVEGLKRSLGSNQTKTFKAMEVLCHAVGKDFNFTGVISTQSQAFHGLTTKLGPSSSYT